MRKQKAAETDADADACNPSPPADSGSNSGSGSQPTDQTDERLPAGLVAKTRHAEAHSEDVGAAAAAQPSVSTAYSSGPGATARATPSESAAAAPAPITPTATAAATATVAVTAASPFSRLASVELQLIMRCCDQSTLIALARCNRFTLAAASHSFAWQSLSPIALQCDWPTELSGQLTPSLLRHADISLTWRLRSEASVSAEQVAALAALPRLRGLTIESAWDHAANRSAQLTDEGAARLFAALRDQIDHDGALASLNIIGADSNIDEAGGPALAAFIARSRTLTTLKITNYVALLPVSGPLSTALIQCHTLTCLEVRRLLLQPEAIRDAVCTLAALVQQSASLATLKLRDFDMNARSAIRLAAAVAHSRNLTDLQLQSCSIGDGGIEALGAAMEQSGCIRKLDLKFNRFGAIGSAALARLLASDRCALTSLDVSQCQIGREGALALAGALQTNRTLTELRFYGIACSEGTAALLSALQRNPHFSLRVLGLSHNAIGVGDASAWAEVIGRSVNLERLEIRGCELGDEEMAALPAGIGHSHSLQHLDLSFNRFGAGGAAALAAAIATCPALTTLDVSGTRIGDAGMTALAPVLIHVRTLNLNECGLTSESAAPLADVIRCGRVLDFVDACSNNLEARGVAEIAAALQPTTSLRVLRVESEAESADGADGMVALARALGRGWKASELRLDYSRSIDDDRGALALASAMERLGDRCTLTTLSLVSCGMTTAGALALVRAATRTPRLRMMDLRYNDSISAADQPALLAACGSQPHFELGLVLF